MLYERLKPAFDLIGKIVGGATKIAFGWLAKQLEIVCTVIGVVAEGIMDLIQWFDKLLAPIDRACRKLGEYLGLRDKAAEQPAQQGANASQEAWRFQLANLDKQIQETQAEMQRVGILDKSYQALQNKLANLNKQRRDLQLAHASSTPTAPAANSPLAETLPTDTGGAGSAEQQKIYNLTTIEGLQNNISRLQERMQRASLDEAVTMQRKVNELQKLLKELQSAISVGASVDSSMGQKISGKAPSLKAVQGFDIKGVTEGAADQLYKATKRALERTAKLWTSFAKGVQSNLQGISSIMGTLGNIVSGNASSWLQWGANVLSAIAGVLPQLLALFTGNISVAASEAAKSQSGIPIIGPIAAVSAVASVVGALLSLPKPTAFAEGGIVSGPTYALVGEYPGATNNPEVIAPLNKLRSLIQEPSRDNNMGGEVTFRIEGRHLVGILNKESRLHRLS